MKKIRICFTFFIMSLFCAVALGFSADQFYTVQKGDTLWDLSRQFYQDNELWPNLWKNNPSIKNPNLIHPGTKLYYLTGSQNNPEQAKEEPAKAEKTHAFSPALKPAAQQAYFSYLQIKSVGFMSNDRIEAKGIIASEAEGKQLISNRDLVYIKSAEYGVLKPGSKWMIFKQVKSPFEQVKSRPVFGFHYRPAGEVEIIKNEYPILGRIITAYLPIAEGDELHPMPDNIADVPLKYRSDGLEAAIIKAEPPVDEIAQYNIVYINKGRKDGVEVGNSFEVLGTVQAAGLEEKVPVAEIIVLRVSDDFSSALVTCSKRSFSLGETVRAKSG